MTSRVMSHFFIFFIFLLQDTLGLFLITYYYSLIITDDF
jgi:hypothetical protein